MLIGLRNGMLYEDTGTNEYWGLCFTALQSQAEISLTKSGTPQTTPSLLYSLDGDNWQTFTPNVTVIQLNGAGSKVWLKAGPNGNSTINTSVNTKCWYFLIKYGNVAASGNIMSLLDGNNQTTTISTASCFCNLFQNCDKLITAPQLPATTLSQHCYKRMFYNCKNLVSAPALPATMLANNCYSSMFSYCTSLVQAPALPATTLADYCYYEMFESCRALANAPALPATSLADYCYYRMFFGCASLTQAPALPATTLATGCYGGMFIGCTSLAQAPALPASSLVYGCYESMFAGCTSLTTAPALSATTLADYCYSSMFNSCTSLTTAPALSATTLADSCYSYMFDYCYNLTSAPQLPATTLAWNCYAGMFRSCWSLASAPDLPATQLAQNCYASMFDGCSNLASASFSNSYETDLRSFLTDNNYSYNMFNNVNAPYVTVTYLDGQATLEDLLTSSGSIAGIKFTNVLGYGSVLVYLEEVGSPSQSGGWCDLQYSTDGTNWQYYNVGNYISLDNIDDYVIFKANSSYGLRSVDDSNYYRFVVNNDPKVEGDLSYLYTDDPDNNNLIDYQLTHLFENCTFCTQSGDESEVIMPSQGKWEQIPSTYAFAYMFYNTDISRITIPVDQSGFIYASFDTNFYNWVLDIRQTYGTMTLPSDMNIDYGDSGVPQNWTIEYST